MWLVGLFAYWASISGGGRFLIESEIAFESVVLPCLVGSAFDLRPFVTFHFAVIVVQRFYFILFYNILF